MLNPRSVEMDLGCGIHQTRQSFFLQETDPIYL
jgi:hypothetical protein